MRYPTKFYGVNVRAIRTEADATAALDGFIRNANDSEFAEACRELEVMDSAVRMVINGLLWKLEYDLSSPLWERCFELKYHSC